MTERDLVVRFKEARDKRDKAKEAQENAQKELDKAEHALVEYLDAKQAETTSKFESLGYARKLKPRLFASCNKEHQEELFAFLKKLEREDLIKPTVAAPSLSSFVSECVKDGIQIPEFISIYYKQSIGFYPAKK